MGSTILPILLITSVVLAAAVPRARRAVRRGVYPGSAAHRDALAAVDDGTAPAFRDWRRMSTAEQAAHDRQAIARADRAHTPERGRGQCS
ncbi:hypothetical protein [Streptomyces sp. NRRL F-5135]|uniref:hypothetical protein n=1 Tax=Streptomyces sp. NRRL F-5135 TaxID=1463858 RepID=UPI0004C9779D|nr:hypothetical protein [Streptomyces sp. NRRL F-5135]